jgi:hypothetical protein
VGDSGEIPGVTPFGSGWLIVASRLMTSDIVAQGIADAKRYVREHTREIDAYVFGCDGLVKLSNGSKIDALILEGSESKLTFRFVFAERYRRNEKGEPVIIVRPDGSFARKDEQLLLP